jgi:membrane-associated protein
MHYGHFLHYNFIGGLAWVLVCVSGGYFFGNIPFVQEHFSLVALGIVLISLLPMVFAYLKHRFSKTTAE